MHQDPSGPGVALEKSTIPEKSGFSGSFGPGQSTLECLQKKVILKNACLLQLAKVWRGVCIGLGKEGKGEEGKRGKGGKKTGACRLNKNNVRQYYARVMSGKGNYKKTCLPPGHQQY